MAPLTCLSKERIFHLKMKGYLIQNTEPVSLFTRSNAFIQEDLHSNKIKANVAMGHRLYNSLFECTKKPSMQHVKRTPKKLEKLVFKPVQKDSY